MKRLPYKTARSFLRMVFGSRNQLGAFDELEEQWSNLNGYEDWKEGVQQMVNIPPCLLVPEIAITVPQLPGDYAQHMWVIKKPIITLNYVVNLINAFEKRPSVRLAKIDLPTFVQEITTRKDKVFLEFFDEAVERGLNVWYLEAPTSRTFVAGR